MLTSSQKAFTLVEVTIALGIVSFAVVASLGVLPTGLRTVRESMDDGARRVILAGVRTEMATLGQKELAAALTNRYFDHEGGTVASSGDVSFALIASTSAPKYPGATFADGVAAAKLGSAVAIEMEAQRSSDPKAAFSLVLPENGR